MGWTIELTTTASKQLSKIDKKEAKRIVQFLRERVLGSGNPRSRGKALMGAFHGFWRYRVGDYRIICDIQDREVRILVIEVGNRKNIYK